MNTLENMNELIARASTLAANGSGSLSTGYLLLAVMTGKGTAANTLSLRGLTETGVRGAMRSMDPEPNPVFLAVEAKALGCARSVGSTMPSAVHVLAALSSVRECHGYKIMSEAGLDVDNIRNQSLRNMTFGLTREHGTTGNEIDEGKHGLCRKPPPRQLQIRSQPNRARVRKMANLESSIGADEKKEAHRRPREMRPSQRDPNVGMDLEAKQKQMRANLKSGKEIKAPVGSTLKGAAAMLSAAPAPSGGPLRQVAPVKIFSLDTREYPILSSLGRNLTEVAARGDRDPIIGRLREMEQIADVLNKRRANSPCLVGPPGVGKTAVVEGLAARMAAGKVPGLEGRIIMEVRPGDLLTGTSMRGALSERMDALKEEVARAEGNVVLFFDQLHALLGSNDGAEAVGELRTVLERGELPCIAATTQAEYARHVESDPAWARLFTPVEIEEPTEAETVAILEGLMDGYREHHQVAFDPEALAAAARLSSRYIPDKAMPDKAIALLDLAGARARRSMNDRVGADDVAAVLAGQIGVPEERLVRTDSQRLLSLESYLGQRVIGHRHVLTAIGETLRRNAAGFHSGRPIGSFLFLGSTGVGKTETAKALAELMFSDENAMVRMDMSEFSEAHAVARMIGAPPGYIGHEDGGQLTEAVRKRPYCLVLLDEIEKAHRDVVQVLLQVLDDGRLTDGRGRTVVFENTVVVMTSNLGADLREVGQTERKVGFGASTDTAHPNVSDAILSSARAQLPPELWNRIDEPLVFAPLEQEEVADIASLMLTKLASQLAAESGVELVVSTGVVDALIAAGGFDPQLGARPMRRTIQRMVEGPVARIVLSNEINVGGTIVVTGDETGLDFALCNPQLDEIADTSE